MNEILPSQKLLVAKEIAKIRADAESMDIPDDSLNDLVLELKTREAAEVNERGFAAQIEYIYSHFGFGLTMMAKARDAINEVFLGFAPRSQLVRCAQCDEDELKKYAKQDGQKYYCRKCQRDNPPSLEGVL